MQSGKAGINAFWVMHCTPAEWVFDRWTVNA